MSITKEQIDRIHKEFSPRELWDILDDLMVNRAINTQKETPEEACVRNVDIKALRLLRDNIGQR